MKGLVCLLLILCYLPTKAQLNNVKMGREFKITSAHGMFPDSLRNAKPRIYQGKSYEAAQHYNDSSAYVFVPNYFDAQKPYHFVIWIHGWNNSIDTALKYFRLIEQFYAAHNNAIFVFPEGPKFAPDSYAGKFEQPEQFDAFIQDVDRKLVVENILPKAKKRHTLVVAGHSGAYDAIGFILQYTTHTIKATLLFDALYSMQDVFMNYLNQHPLSKLINIYTDNGGTLKNSEAFLSSPKRKWSYLQTEEEKYTDWDIKANNILFIHSKRGHNSVVDVFERLLKNL